ncbi:alpha/beta hydrolase family protein [Sinomonas susongensis]|uniref:alpha/beta hydrolase family protein n=1 Tax=Sinomonas susongensis TaxID=1324851 RepID=UPI0011089D80|nr:alpha/beta hydrolase [Sinomonas susongensis]
MTTVHRLEGTTAPGARWVALVPAKWNGPLLVYCHGYGADDGAPIKLVPGAIGVERLLSEGYALAASGYSSAGWAAGDGVIDTLALVEALAAQRLHPCRTVVWGQSMGGLVAAALAEIPGAVDGAVSLCGSVVGPVGMMNQAFDAAWTASVLLDWEDVDLIGVTDDRVRSTHITGLLHRAKADAVGRARVALACAFGQLPTWSLPSQSRPREDDVETLLGNQAEVFGWSVLSPRNDMLRRAGGPFSWNVGVDYNSGLERSGFSALVGEMYSRAGLNLEADLQRLAEAPRVAAVPEAAARLAAVVTPTGRLAAPHLTVHQTGDAAPVVTQATAYADRVMREGYDALLRQVFIDRPGHCSESEAELLAALRLLEGRMDTGLWPDAPKEFSAFQPGQFLRPSTETV